MSAPRPSSAFAVSQPAPVRTATLPMYEPPQLRTAHDALWSAIARQLRADGVADAPGRLSRGRPLEDAWLDPDLLLAQTCGYPLVTQLKGRVQLVATPGYRAKGCDGPFHRSAVVVRKADPATGLADLRGRICALNSRTSNTGMNLLRAEVAPLAGGSPFFAAVEVTGSHAASARVVAEGRADLAAIDCVTLDQLQRFEPEMMAGLRVLMWTLRSPGLPLITGPATNAATLHALRRALDAVSRDPALHEARAALRLTGFHILPPSHYRAIGYFEQIAADQGYPVLA